MPCYAFGLQIPSLFEIYFQEFKGKTHFTAYNMWLTNYKISHILLESFGTVKTSNDYSANDNANNVNRLNKISAYFLITEPL